MFLKNVLPQSSEWKISRAYIGQETGSRKSRMTFLEAMPPVAALYKCVVCRQKALRQFASPIQRHFYDELMERNFQQMLQSRLLFMKYTAQ
jgi:hypothetical protein